MEISAKLQGKRTKKHKTHLRKAWYERIEKAMEHVWGREFVKNWPPMSYDWMCQRQDELNAPNFSLAETEFAKYLRSYPEASRWVRRNFPLCNRWFGDFVWPEFMMVVEIDGSSHKASQERDKLKDSMCYSLGWRVFRVRNFDWPAWEQVLRAISKAVPAPNWSCHNPYSHRQRPEALQDRSISSHYRSRATFTTS